MRQLGNDLFLLDFEEIRRTLYCNFRSATRNFSGFTLSVEFYKRNLNLKTRLNYNGGSFCCCISSKKSEKLHRVHLDSKFNMFRKVKLFGEPSFRGSFTKTRLNPARTEWAISLPRAILFLWRNLLHYERCKFKFKLLVAVSPP